jgi:hypothetical protein
VPEYEIKFHDGTTWRVKAANASDARIMAGESKFRNAMLLPNRTVDRAKRDAKVTHVTAAVPKHEG